MKEKVPLLSDNLTVCEETCLLYFYPNIYSEELFCNGALLDINPIIVNVFGDIKKHTDRFSKPYVLLILEYFYNKLPLIP